MTSIVSPFGCFVVGEAYLFHILSWQLLLTVAARPLPFQQIDETRFTCFLHQVDKINQYTFPSSHLFETLSRLFKYCGISREGSIAAWWPCCTIVLTVATNNRVSVTWYTVKHQEECHVQAFLTEASCWAILSHGKWTTKSACGDTVTIWFFFWRVSLLSNERL